MDEDAGTRREGCGESFLGLTSAAKMRFHYGPRSPWNEGLSPWAAQGFAAWNLCRTQMDIQVGMVAVTIGLRYEGCAAILRVHEMDDPEVWDALQIIESEYVDYSNRKK